MGDAGAWDIRSDAGKSGLLAVAMGLVGALFVTLARGRSDPSGNALAAFWLGVLLIGIALGGLIMAESVVLTVDPDRRALRFQRRNFWGRSAYLRPFASVDSVGVVKVGTDRGDAPSYFLVVNLRDGRVEGTGRWSLDPAEINALAEQLAAAIGCGCRLGAPRRPLAAKHLPVALAGSVALYALWFRLEVGPWCPAMWHGTAPPVFILAGFAILLSGFRRFWR